MFPFKRLNHVADNEKTLEVVLVENDEINVEIKYQLCVPKEEYKEMTLDMLVETCETQKIHLESFFQSHSKEEQLRFELPSDGESFILPCLLDLIVLSPLYTEQVYLIPSTYRCKHLFPCFQSPRLRLSPGTNCLLFRFKILEFSRIAQPERKTDKQLLDAALTKKTKGNEAYKEEDYEKAFALYKSCLSDVKQLQDVSEEAIEAVIKDLYIPCYSNLAACDLKLERYSLALRHSKRVLSKDEENKKAYFRKAIAEIHLGLYDEAEDTIKNLKVLPKSSTSVSALHELLKTKKREQQAKEKALATNMFGYNRQSG